LIALHLSWKDTIAPRIVAVLVPEPVAALLIVAVVPLRLCAVIRVFGGMLGPVM
jgi:hypothetical protein